MTRYGGHMYSFFGFSKAFFYGARANDTTTFRENSLIAIKIYNDSLAAIKKIHLSLVAIRLCFSFL